MAFLKIINFLAYSIVNAFSVILLIYCVASWFIHDPFNKFMQIMEMIVNPVLNPIRAVLNRFTFFREFPIDFSTLIAFILCEMILIII